MLFNGKFVFCQFPMLFNGNLKLEKVREGRTDGWTNGQTDGRLEIHPCVPLPNKSSKDCTWSAVPNALHEVIAEEVE